MEICQFSHPDRIAVNLCEDIHVDIVTRSLDADILADGWEFVYDDSKPTCRSLEAPYNSAKAKAHDWQYYVIDGFIISPNIIKLSMNVVDMDFQNSDHNPVFMTFELK